MESASVYQITSFKSRFDDLQDATAIQKASIYGKWTIPYLAAEPSKDGRQAPLEGDFQSIGALLVNSLSSKLAGLLFPTTHPFMVVNLTPEGRRVMEEALTSQGGSAEDLNVMLSNLVSTASSKAFSGRAFFQLVLAFKHLIVTGNVAIKRNEEEQAIQCFGLNNFVVRRDGLGRVVEAIIKEDVYFGTLHEDVQNYVRNKGNLGADSADLRNRAVSKYTRIYRRPNDYVVEQGIDDVVLGNEFTSTYEKHKLPYIFPTWTLINGEHYGRSLVEDLKGDFAKLSAISEALAKYEIEALRVVFGVSAESFDAIDELSLADTGEYVRVSPGAVQVIETGAAQKVQYILEDFEVVFGRLARAMMWRANTRSGDRITAYEIRQEIEEVEAGMGGAYSALAENLQLPLSYLFLFETDSTLIDAILDAEAGGVYLTTGISALSKTTKAQRILEVLAEAGQAVEIASQMDQRIDPKRIVDLFFEAKGLDFSELKKSDEELQAEAQIQAQEAQAQQMMAQSSDAGTMMGAGMPETSNGGL